MRPKYRWRTRGACQAHAAARQLANRGGKALGGGGHGAAVPPATVHCKGGRHGGEGRTMTFCLYAASVLGRACPRVPPPFPTRGKAVQQVLPRYAHAGEADGAVVHAVEPHLARGEGRSEDQGSFEVLCHRFVCPGNTSQTCPAGLLMLVPLVAPAPAHLVATVVNLHPGPQRPAFLAQRHHKRVHPVVIERAAAIRGRHLLSRGRRGGRSASHMPCGTPWLGSSPKLQARWLARPSFFKGVGPPSGGQTRWPSCHPRRRCQSTT